jgi:hypothetical protein
MSITVVGQILNHCARIHAADHKPFAGPPQEPDTGRTSETIGDVLFSLRLIARYESRAAGRRDKAVQQITLKEKHDI